MKNEHAADLPTVRAMLQVCGDEGKQQTYGPLGYISPATTERDFYNAELTAKIAAE